MDFRGVFEVRNKIRSSIVTARGGAAVAKTEGVSDDGSSRVQSSTADAQRGMPCRREDRGMIPPLCSERDARLSNGCSENQTSQVKSARRGRIDFAMKKVRRDKEE